MTTAAERNSGNESAEQAQQSLATAAARNLATTTKTPPQMQGITSRWLLRVLPWVQVTGGTFRVNRRLSHTLGDGRVEFVSTGSEVRVIPLELTELPALRGFDDQEVLEALAGRCEQRDFRPGEVLVEEGRPADQLVLIAHGKLRRSVRGRYDEDITQGVLADGDFVGDDRLTGQAGTWDHTLTALTSGTVLTLERRAFDAVLADSASLRSHLAATRARIPSQRTENGESAIELASGHVGEAALPGTYVDYELSPREYELEVAQTVLRVHTRVADLYNHPMNQLEEQLRLTIEALRERQEHDLINNSRVGLLHNAEMKQRIHTRSGPPTPDDLDELLATVWKDPSVILAHPKAIAAIGRECSKRGLYPQSVDYEGHSVPAWRGVPILPCNKIPVSPQGSTSVLAMRTGEKAQGVVGLHQTGIPDEYSPSLSVRFMGINETAVMSYLVSAYYSAAVLVPDALGILEDVELGH
ncbi:cyclic nucleotide-binding domain-containing protein [Streptomyces sp. A73]|uniref:family 2B encapsulin nanocompartment shell protein n=1 Tax=unclassified Streptomyces TaxID=2593676 RepID=UPI000C179600|nr:MULTISPECIES: family 2B encapsulin nanocompartment shell protein [unclassified Streptomyces]MBQ0866024.1 cyclic nucleotide-binding domain-containing protein [Streptomyces sp. RK75]MBQ1121934.1 cyclic nucleotide-binding domain-containing protein [Streptomyces sp. B15]MBQ1159247.1 cyclic nucleotide-binding domain-containing protein [Streptomyces sp. A73]